MINYFKKQKLGVIILDLMFIIIMVLAILDIINNNNTIKLVPQKATLTTNDSIYNFVIHKIYSSGFDSTEFDSSWIKLEATNLKDTILFIDTLKNSGKYRYYRISLQLDTIK